MKWPVLVVLALGVALGIPLWHGYTFVPSDLISWTLPWNHSQSVQAQNHFYVDVIGEHYPWKVFLSKMFRGGQIPLWNPYNLFGVPFLASSTTQVFDLTNAAYLWLSPRQAFDVVMLLKPIVAGVGIVWLLHHYGVSVGGQAIGAVSYMLNGAFVGNAHFGWMTGAWMWMPFVVVFLERACAHRATRDMSCASLCLGAAHLAGDIQISLQILLCLGLWATASTWTGVKTVLPGRWRALAVVAAVLVVGSAVAAIQFVPTAELMAQGFSRSYSFGDWFDQWPHILLRLPFVASFALPGFFGHHTIYSPVTALGINWSDLTYGYVGLLPFILAGIAAFNQERAVIRTWTVVALGCLTVVFLTPLVVILYYRALIVWCFAVAVLAGFGFDRLLVMPEAVRRRMEAWLGITALALIAGIATLWIVSRITEPMYFPVAERYIRARVTNSESLFRFNANFYVEKARNTFRYFRITNPNLLTPVGVLLALAAALGALRRRRASTFQVTAIVVGLTALDLLVFTSSYVPVVSLEKWPLYPQTGALRFLSADHSLFRVESAALASVDPPILHFEANIVADLQASGGCGSLNYSRTERFNEFFDGARRGPDPERFPHVVALSNIKYVLTKTLTLPTKQYRLVYDDEIKVYETRDVMPRAYMVRRYRVLQPEAVLELIKTGFDQRSEVLLEHAPVALPLDSAETAFNSAVTVELYTPREVLVRSRADSGGLVVLSDTNYPGWTAKVDGVQAEVLNANYIFRAVAVPAGTHTIEFSYRPWSFRIGAGVTGFTTVLCVIGIVWTRVRSRWTGAKRKTLREAMGE